jgi:hypothetical protein
MTACSIHCGGFYCIIEDLDMQLIPACMCSAAICTPGVDAASFKGIQTLASALGVEFLTAVNRAKGSERYPVNADDMRREQETFQDWVSELVDSVTAFDRVVAEHPLNKDENGDPRRYYPEKQQIPRMKIPLGFFLTEEQIGVVQRAGRR